MTSILTERRLGARCSKAERPPCEKVAFRKPRREASKESKLAATLMLDSSLQKCQKINLLLRPPSLWYSVMEAQASWQNPWPQTLWKSTAWHGHLWELAQSFLWGALLARVPREPHWLALSETCRGGICSRPLSRACRWPRSSYLFTHHLFSIRVSVSRFPLFLRTPVIVDETPH